MKNLIKVATSSIVGLTLIGTAFQARPSLAQTNSTTENSVHSIRNQAHLLQGIEVEGSELNLAVNQDDVNAIAEDLEEDYQLSMSENDVSIIEQDRQTWAPRPFWGNKGDGIDYSILVDVYDF